MKLNLKDGLAVKGFDVTEFFNGKAVEGSTNFLHLFENGTYKFASETNLENFKSDPQKYLPQYGGCLLYTSPSPRDRTRSRMPSSA